MIIALFLEVVGLFMALLSGLLPNWAIPTEIMAIFEGLAPLLTLANGYLPVDTILYCIYLGVLFEGTVLMVRLILGIVSLLRGGGKIDV